MSGPLPPDSAPTPARHRLGLSLLLLVTLIWGSTFAVVKDATALLHPATLIAWRFSIGALSLLPLLLGRPLLSRPLSGRPAPERPQRRDSGADPVNGDPVSSDPVNSDPVRRDAVSTGLRGGGLNRGGLLGDSLLLGLWLVAGYGTQTLALTSTSANRTAFITALSVVLVPLWQALVQRRALPAPLWISALLAVCGLALLGWEGGALGVGDAWALACAVTYAGFILTLERTARRHDALPYTLAQLLWVAALAWLWALAVWALGGAAPLPPAGAWAALLYLGIAASAATTLMQTLGQRWVSAAEASVIYALEPVGAGVFSFFLLGERVFLRGLVGGALVVGATLLSQFGAGPPGTAPAARGESAEPHSPPGNSPGN